MITTTSRIEDKKPSKFILPPMGILETIPCAKDVDYITQDLAVSSVRLMNNDFLTNLSGATLFHPPSFLSGTGEILFLSSRGVVLENK
ncbi:hypothetical protein Tco_1070785 [Tanacetum coccineum]|uniref:Uncharacterized protein n=1 Tax=Tanacetum coccineum TaxID=301880 RepID=A0ABQ5HMJ3_9ASTR